MTAFSIAGVTELIRALRTILGGLRPLLAAAQELEWNPPDGYLPLVRRAVIVRQYECLEAVVFLAEQNRGFAAIPLLRPACEEFIWIKYLNLLGATDANELLSCLVGRELRDLLRAQDDYAGRGVTSQLGLLPTLIGIDKAAPHTQERLRSLGRRLSWNASVIEKALFPSLRQVAGYVDEVRLYNFLYHATSRYVHFSPVELIRRVWGRPGRVRVGSDDFGDFWTAFSLHWGFELFVFTLGELKGELGGGDQELADSEAVAEAVKTVASFGRVPIVTAEELSWRW